MISGSGRRVRLVSERMNDLPGLLGEWKEVDTDEEESVVYYELSDCLLEIECGLDGVIRRLVLMRSE